MNTVSPLRIVIGSDHAGFPLKGRVIALLDRLGCPVTDVGSYTEDPVDFPDITRAVCRHVKEGTADRGLLVCGTGVGASIAANKVSGIRAAVCHDAHSAHQGVEHDDVNVMCLGAQIVGPWLADDLVTAFIQARFNATEDHLRRVGKLDVMDETRAADH